MANEQPTEIVLVVDRSGSMQHIVEDAQGGINAFIEEQKKVPGEATLTLVQFDTEYEVVHENLPMADVPAFKLKPRGGTALLDALGKTLTSHKKRIENTPEDNRPGKIIYVIVTDGDENSSGEYNLSQIKELITGRRDADAWEFIFLAANQDAMQSGQSMGISKAGTMNFAAAGQGASSAYNIGTRAVNKMRMCDSGQSLSSCLGDMELPENAEGEEADLWLENNTGTVASSPVTSDTTDDSSS